MKKIKTKISVSPFEKVNVQQKSNDVLLSAFSIHVLCIILGLFSFILMKKTHNLAVDKDIKSLNRFIFFGFIITFFVFFPVMICWTYLIPYLECLMWFAKYWVAQHYYIALAFGWCVTHV